MSNVLPSELPLHSAVTYRELVHVLLTHAAQGVVFDRMAVVTSGKDLDQEAIRVSLKRASIPAHFAKPLRIPSPQGKALLALLRFKHEEGALEHLADYLSLCPQPTLPEHWEAELFKTGIPTRLEDWKTVKPASLNQIVQRFLELLSHCKGPLSWTQWIDVLESLAEAALPTPTTVKQALRSLPHTSASTSFPTEAVLDILTPQLSYEYTSASTSHDGKVYICEQAHLHEAMFSVVLHCTELDESNPFFRLSPLTPESPVEPENATCQLDFELNVLNTLFATPPSEVPKGRARFLLDHHPHLGRALRTRALRWRKGRWSSADGFAKPSSLAQQALQQHRPEHRAYSPTALQHLAACPYRFFLYALLGLRPYQPFEQTLYLDPLQRGSLVHEILYEFLCTCKQQAMLPVRPAHLDTLKALLVTTIAEVSARHALLIAPRSLYVWQEELNQIHADLDEWLERASHDPVWEPWLFELSFGLPGRAAQDPQSILHPVTIDTGLTIRGSIDLVERDASGTLRVTDFKTGKARTKHGIVTQGGEVLQPLLYALVLEKMFPDHKTSGGRLHYCSSSADFAETWVSLTPQTKQSITLLKQAIDESFEQSMFVANPVQGRCRFCDYQAICGTQEEERTKHRRSSQDLPMLRQLRSSL